MVDGAGGRLLGIAVMQIGDVQRLAGVTDIMRQHAGGAQEARMVSGTDEGHHRVEDLPYPERQQAAVLGRDAFAGQQVGHRVVELVPAVRIDPGGHLA